VFDAREFGQTFLAERNLMLNASAMLWRRDALRTALSRCAKDLFNYRVAGDWRLYLEAVTSSKGGRVVYVAEPLNIHRRHLTSVTHSLAAERHIKEIRQMHALAASRLGAAPALQDRQRRYLRQISGQLRAAARIQETRHAE
jgi:hypothetical protein